MQLSKTIYFPIIDSTQIQAKQAREMLELNKCILFTTDEQTAGKATRNRQWVSPPNVNIYATYAYLTTKENDRYLINIPQIAAYSVVEVLHEYGLRPTYKWVNDVLLNGKKLCGILAEAEECTKNGEQYRAIYIGVGLNVNMTEDDLRNEDFQQLKEKVISMKIFSGQNFNKQEVLAKLNAALMTNIQLLYSKGFNYFFEKIKAILEMFNGELQWFDIKDEQNNHEIVRGRIVEINAQGFLRLNVNGQIKEFFYGRLLKKEEINVQLNLQNYFKTRFI